VRSGGRHCPHQGQECAFPATRACMYGAFVRRLCWCPTRWGTEKRRGDGGLQGCFFGVEHLSSWFCDGYMHENLYRYFAACIPSFQTGKANHAMDQSWNLRPFLCCVPLRCDLVNRYKPRVSCPQRPAEIQENKYAVTTMASSGTTSWLLFGHQCTVQNKSPMRERFNSTRRAEKLSSITHDLIWESNSFLSATIETKHHLPHTIPFLAGSHLA